MVAKSTFKKDVPVGEVALPVTIKREPERNLFSWSAPSRPFKMRGREFWVRAIAIASVGGLIFFLVEGIMPVILIVSLVFLFYILSTVEPETIEYKITNKGIKVADRRTDWGFLTRFWFSRRFESDLLVFETLNVPGRLEIVVNSKDKRALRKALTTYLLEEESPPTSTDKLANWFSEKLPQ